VRPDWKGLIRRGAELFKNLKKRLFTGCLLRKRSMLHLMGRIMNRCCGLDLVAL
jgi:hypothetical protein